MVGADYGARPAVSLTACRRRILQRQAQSYCRKNCDQCASSEPTSPREKLEYGCECGGDEDYIEDVDEHVVCSNFVVEPQQGSF